MATKKKLSREKKKTSAKKVVTLKKAPTRKPLKATKQNGPSSSVQDVLLEKALGSRKRGNAAQINTAQLEKKLLDFNIRLTSSPKKMVDAINKINPDALLPVKDLPEDIKKSLPTILPAKKRFHGAKFLLAYFPFPWVKSPCADKFGYMSPASVRSASRLAFTTANQTLLGKLGDIMGDPNRDTTADSAIPAGYTYFGQFVDHDITLDVSSSLDAATDANTINNMRSPVLDLDSVYGKGPALDPFLYQFPATGPDTAIKLALGTNLNSGDGGPGGSAGFGGMRTQTDFDVPRIHNPLNPASSSNTAVIGDPRNDENLIVVQFHHAMLKFHNKVVDMLVLAGFTGDIFVEAKKIVTHHYQWAVVNDFLKRVCGPAVIANAMASVHAPIGSAFRMPVEFSVAAFRFGHSMIRNEYWLNFNFINASLGQVFEFNRNPNLPVRSNWVVDFNAFFDTGVAVPVNNKARKIDSFLAAGLESIPGGSGIMSILATRNLRRGLALGLPSGQALAAHFGFPVLTPAQLKAGLLPDEVNVLENEGGGILLTKTPLWYYLLRESMVQQNGERMGRVGAKIIADTFIRMLKRDANSYLHVSGGFTPILPSATPGDFTVTDIITFSGVNQP